MASTVVGMAIQRTPRSQVAATNPARSVVAPPPTPTMTSVRVNPDCPSAFQQYAATSAVLASSAFGTWIATASNPCPARSARRASAVSSSASGWTTATRLARLPINPPSSPRS